MYDVSSIFLDKIRQSSRRVRGKLLLGDVELTYEDIITMDMEYSLGNDNIPAIGGVVASRLNVKLLKKNLPPVITTQELRPYLGIETAPSTIEYVPMGVFRVSPQDIKKTDMTVSIVGYDQLYALEDTPYTTDLTFPATWNNIKADLETKGFKFKAQSLPNVTIKTKPDTIRELLSDIAELLGRNVVSNRLGEIEFRDLNIVAFDLDASNYIDFKLLADDDVKITRLTVEKEGEENKDLTYGDDTGFTIKIKNDSITTQNELITAYNRVFPLSYTAYECNMQGMPHLDVGDIIKLTDRHDVVRNIPIVYHKINYTGGLRSEIKAGAPQGAISSTGSTGSNSITQSLNDLRINILEVNHLLADKASINDLKANTARIDDLYATKASIVDLRATNARVDTLEASYANIDELEARVANIDTILAKEVFVELAQVGKIVAGSSIIADGAIGDAQISSLSADKLDAGAVRTALVDIIGPDGRLKLSGNKLQIFDDGLGTLYERIFLGVDDENNANLTLRGADGQTVLLTQDGLTNAGFTDGYNKLEDNSLDPKKIDIQKVVTRINEGTTTIQASKILVDNKTLDVQFKTIENTVSDHGQTISSHSSSISALDDAISLKVDKQEFREYKTTNDNRVTTIDTQLSKNTSSINVLQDKIALKVTQADIDRSIDKIEVGGMNYLINTDRTLILDSPDKFDTVKYDDCFISKGFTDAVKGKNIILSLDVKVISMEKGATNPWIGLEISYGREGQQGKTWTGLYIINDIIEDGLWHRYYSEPIQIPEDVTYFSQTVTWLIRDIKGSVQTKNPQLEIGNKATDWTPAPEDVESEITAINTQVSQLDINLNSITSRVSSTESNIAKINDDVSSIESRVRSAEQKITDDAIVSTVRRSSQYIDDLGKKVSKNTIISEINQSAETIKIQASKINLVGAVTVLSDITGNLGSITAGTVTGATIRTSSSGDRLQLDSNYLRAYKSGTRRVQLNYDSLDFFNAKNQYSGSLYGVTYPQDDIPRVLIHSKSHVELVARADIDDVHSQNQARVNVSQYDEAHSSIAIEAGDSSGYSMFYVSGNECGFLTDKVYFRRHEIRHEGNCQAGIVTNVAYEANVTVKVRIYYYTPFSKTPSVVATTSASSPHSAHPISVTPTQTFVDLRMRRTITGTATIYFLAIEGERYDE